MKVARSSKGPDLKTDAVELEQYVLGSLLHDNSGVARVAPFLQTAHFGEPLHQRIYEAIVEAVKGGQLATPFSLNSQFTDDTLMGQVGGAVYLSNLMVFQQSYSGFVHLETAARAVFSYAFRRHLIQCARDIQDHAYSAPIEQGPADIARHAERVLIDVINSAPVGQVDRFTPIGAVAHEVVRRITDPEVSVPSVPFGLTNLDELTGGMMAKELVIVGARPGMGKTAFAGHVALSAARQGYGVAFFSLEMPAAQIALRMLTAQIAYNKNRSVAYQAARKGRVSDEDDVRDYLEAEASLRMLPIAMHEGRSVSPSGLLMAARREQDAMALSPYPLGLVIVDHIQKIRPERTFANNKVAEMTEISDALHKMAGALGVPVIALSQLNRMVEARNDKRPELSDLRESGSLEQDADTVLLLYRDAYYHKKKEPPRTSPDYPEWFAKWEYVRHRLDVFLAKQRNGAEGRITCHFDAPSSAIKD